MWTSKISVSKKLEIFESFCVSAQTLGEGVEACGLAVYTYIYHPRPEDSEVTFFSLRVKLWLVYPLKGRRLTLSALPIAQEHKQTLGLVFTLSWTSSCK